MGTKKELENIEPFCDTWFKNCFFNLLFVILKHFNKDVRELLVIDIFLYKHNKNSLTLIEKSMMPIEEILNNIGIVPERIPIGENVIDNFTDSLSNGRPVIAWQDLYFASYRDDFFNRKHWLHAVLLYGFDKSEKYFNIVEQSFTDSYFYKKAYAHFSDILNGNKGVKKHFPEIGNDDAFLSNNVAFYLNDDSTKLSYSNDSNVYQIKFIEIFLRYKMDIEESINQIKSFYNNFKDIISDEILLQNNVDLIIENLNQIINNKKVDLYRYIKLFGLQAVLKFSLLESIINEWVVVRGVLLKFKLTMIYKVQSLNLILNKINNIYQLEQDFYNEFNKFITILKECSK